MTPLHANPSPTARRTGAGRLLAALAFFLTIGLAGGPAKAQDEPVTLNFTNADIEAVVKAVAEITGKSFIVDPRVKGTVTIVSARPVPRSLVYPTLLSALRTQGVTAVESDNVVRIVPESEARLQGGPVGRGAVSATGDRMVTQVIPLRYESAAQLVNVLRPMITPSNTIAAFPSANALIITDYADNLRRLEKVIASLDQPPGGEPVVVPLRYASAIDLVPTLTRLLADPSGAAASDPQQRVTVVADARSNSVLVRADNPGRTVRVRQLIEQLDTPGRAGGNMFIVYLRNAEAARVVQTLRALLTGQDSSAPSTGGLSQQPSGQMALGTTSVASSPTGT
jgi:general secretion pathway protein D